MVRVRTYARTLGPTLPKIIGKRRGGPFHTDREIGFDSVTLGLTLVLEDGLNSVLGRPSIADKQRVMIFAALTRSWKDRVDRDLPMRP